MPNRSETGVSLDVVVPVYNEESALPQLIQSVQHCFGDLARTEAGLGPVRIIFVDDGSTDSSSSLIADEIKRGLQATLIRFSRNFGHQNAVSAGMSHSSGRLVAIIDADLQDPPEVILRMVDRWRRGADVVFGRRTRRKEGPVRRTGYWLFYRIVHLLADVSVPLDSGDFCLMSRKVVDAICALPENQRFPRGLRAWVGFRQEAIEYDRPARSAGATKYTFRKLYRLATDGIASLSTRPLRLAQFVSVVFGLASLVAAGATAWRIALGAADTLDTKLLMLALVVFAATTVQMAYLYILGAYVSRTYLEVKGRPSYIVDEIVGVDRQDSATESSP